MNEDERKKATEWIKKQSKQMETEIPDRQPGEPPATQKQKDYIRALVLEIDEKQLDSLGKWQASAFIDEIKYQKKVFTDEKAKEYMAQKSRGCLVFFVPIVAAAFYFVTR